MSVIPDNGRRVGYDALEDTDGPTASVEEPEADPYAEPYRLPQVRRPKPHQPKTPYRR